MSKRYIAAKHNGDWDILDAETGEWVAWDEKLTRRVARLLNADEQGEDEAVDTPMPTYCGNCGGKQRHRHGCAYSDYDTWPMDEAEDANADEQDTPGIPTTVLPPCGDDRPLGDPDGPHAHEPLPEPLPVDKMVVTDDLPTALVYLINASNAINTLLDEARRLRRERGEEDA